MNSKNKISLIIPAGGTGNRFGSDLPKQYHKLGATSILTRTIMQFAEIPDIDSIVVNIAPEYLEDIKKEIDSFVENYHKIEILTCPGKERQDTVRRALEKSQALAEADIILVHDAVRAGVTSDLILDIIREAIRTGAVCPGIMPKNTIKRIDSEAYAVETPDRTMLREIQTPQGFRKDILVRAYKRAARDSFFGTDSASLVERLGIKVKIIEGRDNNFKITTPSDYSAALKIIGGDDA